jgi:metallophosphoesterase (TIGR03768 family)
MKGLRFFFTIVLVLLLAVGSGCATPTRSEPGGYPIASDVFTTLQRTVVPVAIPSTSEKILPFEISKYERNGYGLWQYGTGIPSVRRLDLMPASYTGASVVNTSRILDFFTMTDIHITDEESPTQAIVFGYKGGSSSAYSPTMMYATQVLDAAVQTINALNRKDPFDFGIILGDVANSAQFNELRWYIDVLDGRNVRPDSGIQDDPIPGPGNDYQDEFKAVGIDRTIPWYQVLGNHDKLNMGIRPVDDALRRTYVGEFMLETGRVLTDPLGLASRGFYMGALDGRTPNGDVYGAGPVSEFADPPKVLAADPDRRPLSRREWMAEFFQTASIPVGHGFSQANLDGDSACYSFDAGTNLPVKVIVLDDTQGLDDFDLHVQGSLDEARFDWLVDELDKGQAEGKLMVIAAHVPICLLNLKDQSPVSQKELVSKLNSYPNLLLWVAGHYHNNTVTAYPSPDSSHPELGFWQVETSSLRDFPQQFRTFRILLNSDATVSILSTDVDPAVKDGSLAALSREYAVATEQLFANRIGYLPTGSYNAELVKQLSPGMQEKLKKLPGASG